MLRELNRFTQKHGNVAFLALLVVLVVPMIFVFGSGGCDQHSGSLTGKDAFGMLGEKVVTSADYKHQAQAEAIQYYLKTGKVVNLQAITRRPSWVMDYKEPVLLRMRILMFAKERGFDQVTDAELGKYKANQKAFQNDKGQFVPEKYQTFITEYFENQPITVADFDQMCRENIVIDRLESMLETETTNVAALRANILANGGDPNYKLKEFNRRNYMNQTVSDDDVKKVYDTEKNSTYLDPQKHQAMLAVFPVAELPEGAEPVTDAEVKAYYETNIDTFTNEAEVKASHILISYKGAERATVTRTKKEAKSRAEMVLKEANAKDADFAKLAAKYSDGPTGSKGGDLGFFSRKGPMDEAVAKAAFGLKRGEISGVVETPFGFHIIKKTAEKAAAPRPLDSVKVGIRMRLINERQDTFFAKQAQDIYKKDKADNYSKAQATIKYMGITKSDAMDDKEKKLDKEKAESIHKEAASAKDLVEFAKATQTKYPKIKITQGERKHVEVERKDLPEYIKQGFALKVGETSAIIDEPDAFYIVQKVSERSSQPFSEVRSEIITTLKSDARNQAIKDAEAKAEAFLTALKAKSVTGKAALDHFSTLAKAQNVTAVETPFLSKSDSQYLRDFLGGTYPKPIFSGISKTSEANPFSSVFRDYKNAYVACFKEIKPAQAPKFEDVKATIYGNVLEQKSIEAAQAAADKLQKELNETLAKGLVPKELSTFRAPNEYPQQSRNVPEPENTAKQLSYSTKVGEVSIQNLPGRGAVLVYVEGREKQDKQEVTDTFNRMSKNLVTSSNQMKFFRQYNGEQGVMLLADYSFVKSLEQRYRFEVKAELESLFSEKDK